MCNFVVMLTLESYHALCTEEVRRAIHENRDRDPLRIALDGRIPEARLVATEVKYLQRARTKLPSYAEAECILPPLAFEQSSSEQCAAHKPLTGERVLDLTCGLGVDTLFLSRKFKEVVSLERNEVLCAVTQENLRRLGVKNVTLKNTSAEEYLASATETFDWIYADPDRRSAEGRKLVRLEDCSPNIVELMPHLKRLAPRLCLKNSPLFDVDEALNRFPESHVEVLSLGGECKEVLIYVGEGISHRLTATALGLGSYSTTRPQTPPQPEVFRNEAYRWLIVPDVALQKARLVRQALDSVADVWSENGFGFAVERPEGVLGRVLEIERIEKFDPKGLKKSLKGKRVELLKRDFPLSVEELQHRLGVRSGSEKRLAFTNSANEFWTIHLK